VVDVVSATSGDVSAAAAASRALAIASDASGAGIAMPYASSIRRAIAGQS
jgi:hypothetical protein